MAELTRQEFRAAILYDYKRGLSVDECTRSLKSCFGELRAPSRTTVFNRFRDFKAGRNVVLDSQMDNSSQQVFEHVETVRELTRLDPSITCLEIAKRLGLDLGVVQKILRDALKLGQLNQRWTPLRLTDTQRSSREDWASFMLDKFNYGNGASTDRIIACFDTWVYKCRTVKKSTRVTTEYWTFEASSRVIDKRMVVCFFSRAGGVSVLASVDNLRLLAPRDLIDGCLRDVVDEWSAELKDDDRFFLYMETLARSSARLLDFLHDQRLTLLALPECSADLALGGSFLEPGFWVSVQKQRFPTHEDAVNAYKDCLNSAVPEMWEQLFAWWFKRMSKCVRCAGDYVKQINFNLDLIGTDAATIMVNPNSVMPSHMSVRTPASSSTTANNNNNTTTTSATTNGKSTTTTTSSSSSSAGAKKATTTTTTTTTMANGGTATINGIKRHFNFSPKVVEIKEEKHHDEKELVNGDLEDADNDGESDAERDYDNDASESEDDEDEESEDDEPTLQATPQPHGGLKLTIPSSNGNKSKTTLLLPASTIKTISPQLIKAQQQQAAAALKVNGITGIRLQNFKILGHQSNGAGVQQLRRQIYSNGAHIVAQAQAQQQQQLIQQQLVAAAAAAAAASSSPNGARKSQQEKELDAMGHDYDDKAYPKPAYSYSCLIAMALKNSQTGSLPVSEIYNFMCEHFPYFKTAPNGWKNSVRHNLSLNKCFEKIEKPAGNGNQRKGCLWAINPAKIAKMDEEVQKWSRKDPLAIKKAMIYPDHLELLERGEMKFVGSGSNGDLSEETESSGDEAEGAEETVHGHQLAANSVTDSYDESSQDCDVDVSEQLYDEIDIDDNKDSLHMQLNISSKQDDYQLSPSAKRQKTLTGTLQANYVYQPVATARRKTPLTFLTTGAAAGSFLKIE